MGVVTGSITVASSDEDVAYSQDPDVVPGDARAGCGWCPVDEFERVGDGADIVTGRTLNDRERTHYRDVYARIGPASANVYAATASVRSVVTQVEDRGRKVKKRLEGAKAAEWVKAVARTNPVALDLYADRVICRTNGREPSTLYADCRNILGYPPAEEEVGRADGDSKSEPAAG